MPRTIFSSRFSYVLRTSLWFCCLLFLLTGCATKVKEKETFFWPPPPNDPRVQYLTEINKSADIEGRSGVSLVSFGESAGQGGFILTKPFGLSYSAGKLYICDSGTSEVYVVDLLNKSFDRLKGNYSLGKLQKPVKVKVGPEGNIYIADTLRREILIYNQDGEFLKSFGRRDGMNMKPVDLAVTNDRIYVVDYDHSEVKVFDRKTYKFIDSMTGKNTENSKRLALPVSMLVDGRDNLLVANLAGANVIKLDRDGHYLEAFGQRGDSFGSFSRPRGMANDSNGRVYIVDAGHNNVQIFNQDSQLLMFFGGAGSPGGAMLLPADVDVTDEKIPYLEEFVDKRFKAEQYIFVTNQFGPRKIAIYALGELK